MAITPRGMSITEAYRAYRDNKFIVNRSYQRKLVWTEVEKVKLIDSILKQYPVPLILLALTTDGYYEIIDGMQRLNAIFSFIENSFPLYEMYFDLDEFARAKQAAIEGYFEAPHGVKKLSAPKCADILDYQLAVTIFPLSDDSNVTNIFGRINSGGKQLSPQEQRQAGVITPFASFVRQLSSELRGDASEELVNLSDMPLVSIEGPTFKLGYGVKAEDTFWCKQGVLRAKELRDSLDEQIVADLSISILMNEPFALSRENLDEAYIADGTFHSELNDRLSAYPADQLAKELKTTFSCLIEVIESFNPTPNTFRRTVNPKAGGNPVRTPFYAIFHAFFELVIRQQKKPTDNVGIMTALENIAPKLETTSHHVKPADRKKNIDLTTGLIQKFFAYTEPPLLTHGPGLSLDFENSLRRSKIETARYEFKQGVLRLADSRPIENELFKRLAEIACSMANLGPRSTGYLFIGVADRSEHAERIKNLDSITPIKINDVFVVGIDREAQILKMSIEDYIRMLISEIRKTDLSDPLKTDILSNFDVIQYRNHSVIRITIPQQNEMAWVGEKTYIREHSNTVEATTKQATEISKKFS
jgi:hypothetical protein